MGEGSLFSSSSDDRQVMGTPTRKKRAGEDSLRLLNPAPPRLSEALQSPMDPMPMLQAGNAERRLKDDIRAATGLQDFVAVAPLNLVYVAHGERMTDVSPQDRRLFASVDAGFIGQNVYLFCASQGLATVFRGAVPYAELTRKLALPPEQFVPQLMGRLELAYYVALLSAAQYHGSRSAYGKEDEKPAAGDIAARLDRLRRERGPESARR
jgi:nitroreductase